MFGTLKSRIIISISGVIFLSLCFSTIFFNFTVSHELRTLIEENALNSMESTKFHVISQYTNIMSYREKTLFSRKKEMTNLTDIAYSIINNSYGNFEKGLINKDVAQEFVEIIY